MTAGLAEVVRSDLPRDPRLSSDTPWLPASDHAPHARLDLPQAPRRATSLVWTIHNRGLGGAVSDLALRALDEALDTVDIRQMISTSQASAQALVAIGAVSPGLVGPRALLSTLDSSRLGPEVAVVRPADVAETVESWRFALARAVDPTAIVIETSPARPLGACPAGNIADLGARVVDGYGVTPDMTILASGSDVSAALNVSKRLRERGYRPRVLSVPYRARFDRLAEGQRARLVDDAPVVVVIDSDPAAQWRADLVVAPGHCARTLASRVARLLAGAGRD